MQNKKDFFTVLEKTGKRIYWKEEEIGEIIGGITGDRQVYVQPPDRDEKNPSGPRWLIIDGRIEEGRLAAFFGHHHFSLTFRRSDNLPFDISREKRR